MGALHTGSRTWHSLRTCSRRRNSFNPQQPRSRLVCRASTQHAASPSQQSGSAQSSGACCHHGHAHFEESAVSRLLQRAGLVDWGSRLGHSGRWTIISCSCFLVALLLGTPLLTRALGERLAPALQSCALACTFVLSGLPQTVEAMCIAGSGKLDTHVLMSLAVIGTMFLGMAQEGALLVLLFQISHTLEEKFTSRARGSLERLFANIPTQAMLVELDATSGSPLMQTASQALAKSVRPGQHILVKLGEQVPLDGTVAWGVASVSMQHISGESQPVCVEPGSAVPAGSINTDGLLVIRVTSTVDDSTPARIARMTQAAQAAKPKLQRTLDHVSEVWSKAVIAVTLITLFALPLLGVPMFGPRGALYRAMGVLTAGSPCALVLVPLAYVCAIATITRKGVLVKSAAVLDQLHQCHTVALDKTGTITTGSLTLSETQVICSSPCCSPLDQTNAEHQQQLHHEDVERLEHLYWHLWGVDSAAKQLSENLEPGSSSSSSSDGGSGEMTSSVGRYSDAMRYCLALSQGSNHPVSRAVVEAACAMPDNLVQVEVLEQVPGMGVEGICRLSSGADPMVVRFGSLEFIRRGLHCDSLAAKHLEEAAREEQKGDAAAKAMSFLMVAPCKPDKLPGALDERPGALDSLEEQAVWLMREPSLDTSPSSELLLSDSEVFLAMLCFEDRVDPTARRAVASLMGGTWRLPEGSNRDIKEVIMLTGDNLHVAKHVARQVGIDIFYAGLKPENKLSFITSFFTPEVEGPDDSIGSGRNATVAVIQGQEPVKTQGLLMMGDGINDAPALAAAHVGVAIANTPSDLVAAAADLVVLNGRGVSNLPWLFAVSQKTQHIISQNLTLALVSVVFATLPTIAGFFPLWLAVLLHEGATVLVALNSLRLLTDPQSSSFKAAINSSMGAVKELFSDHDHDHGHDHSHDHSHDHHSCGHDHGHSHDHSHTHGHDQPSCGHDHGHEHGHDHSQEQHNCGHDHSHDHGHDCGHDHGHEHGHDHSQKQPSCGHDHSHEHGHDHSHDHGHDQHSCGHDHGHDSQDKHSSIPEQQGAPGACSGCNSDGHGSQHKHRHEEAAASSDPSKLPDSVVSASP